MPNGDENELVIGDTVKCLSFPEQRYSLQVGGAAKGLGSYPNFRGAMAAVAEHLAPRPDRFILIKGETDKKVYFMKPGVMD